MTPKIMAWVIKELQWKPDILNKTGYVRVLDVVVIKSDTVISKDLQEALKEGVRPLNDVLGDHILDLIKRWLTWCIHHFSRSFMAELTSYWTALLNLMTV